MSEKTTAESIVAKLAEWSKKYPRGTVYPMSKISMDNELIEIENLAKRYAPSPALQDAVKEIAFPVSFDRTKLEIKDKEGYLVAELFDYENFELGIYVAKCINKLNS